LTAHATDALALESLLAFWADAGVDACLADEPVDKLRRPAPPAAAAAATRPAPAAPARAAVEAAPDVANAVAAAQALAQAAPDLAALEASMQGFDGGGHRPASARRILFARGAPAAAVVVVGGPPGADEDGAGSAFAGAAGRLLDRMLAAAGLNERALLLHVTPWRTPGDRPPTDAEAAVALPFVRRAIALAAPAALLVLGDLPARLLLNRAEGVLKLRGAMLDTLSQAGDPEPPKALVTFGPAFLLKQPAMKAQAWRDLLTLARAVATARNDP
jgi:DNA polymerase